MYLTGYLATAMRVELEDWKNGSSGLHIGVSKAELPRLIELLQILHADPEQHFHISSDNQAAGGIGDIEIYVKAPEEKDNMRLSSRAKGAGEESGTW